MTYFFSPLLFFFFVGLPEHDVPSTVNIFFKGALFLEAEGGLEEAKN